MTCPKCGKPSPGVFVEAFNDPGRCFGCWVEELSQQGQNSSVASKAAELTQDRVGRVG